MVESEEGEEDQAFVPRTEEGIVTMQTTRRLLVAVLAG